jgi:ribosome recycling factor
MDAIIANAESKMKKSISSLESDYSGLRTGRASTALFDKIQVEYYGSTTPLNQVANISIPEARLVVIQPWDKNSLPDIEKAILSSELSLNPNNDGKVIRINIPPLTEERRKELVKMAKSLAEQGRVSIRNIRREANDTLKKEQKDGDISEDEMKKGLDEVQKITDSYVKIIDGLSSDKEKEILDE